MIRAYCQKDLSFIPLHMDDRTYFIGPRVGQVMNGGTVVENAWLPGHEIPNFSVSGISADSVATSATTCEVILRYMVTWHKKDESVLVHPQTMQVSWFLSHSASHPDSLSSHSASAFNNPDTAAISSPVQMLGDEAYKMYRVAVMHISNPEQLDERDLVYNTFGDIATATLTGSSSISTDKTVREGRTGKEQKNEWIIIPGVGATLSRYPSGSIIWIDSAAGGKKSTVHTRDQEIRCVNPVSYFMEEYPGIFLQPSVSFIVNPLYVKTIKRFQIDLWDGHTLRVPEKKYTKFKKEFEEFFG